MNRASFLTFFFSQTTTKGKKTRRKTIKKYISGKSLQFCNDFLGVWRLEDVFA